MTTALTQPRPQNPFESARLKLIQALLSMKAPKPISTFPIPCEFNSVADHLREAATIFDEWLGAIGHQVADNASHNVDMRVFEGAFTGAIDGNATYEIENVAERMMEDRHAA